MCDVDEIPNKQLYINFKNDYNLLHEGVHIEMLLLNCGFKWKKENYIWRHPFVITDRICDNLSFSNQNQKQYNNCGWYVAMLHTILKLMMYY